MSRNHKLLVALLVVACLGLAGYGAYLYSTRPRPPKTESLSDALTAQKTLENELRIMQAVDGANINNLKASNAQLTTQKQQACAVIAAHRLVSPACQ